VSNANDNASAPEPEPIVPLTPTTRTRRTDPPLAESGTLRYVIWGLDRFGAPTFVLVIVLIAFGYYYKTQREDTQTDRKAFVESLEKHNTSLGANSAVLVRVVDKLEQMDRKVDHVDHDVHDVKDDVKDIRDTVNRIELVKRPR